MDAEFVNKVRKDGQEWLIHDARIENAAELAKKADLEGFVKEEELQGYAKQKDLENLATKEEVSGKQDALVSGENIKTINNQSILGSGDLAIGGGSAIAIEEGALNIGPGAIPTPLEVVDDIPFFHEGHSFDLQPIADAVVAEAQASGGNPIFAYDALTGEEIDIKTAEGDELTRPVIMATAMQLPVAEGIEAEPTYGFIVVFARFAGARPYALLTNFDVSEKGITNLPVSELSFDICSSEDLNRDDDQADAIYPSVALPDCAKFGILFKELGATFQTYYNSVDDTEVFPYVNAVKTGDIFVPLVDDRIAEPGPTDEDKVLTNHGGMFDWEALPTYTEHEVEIIDWDDSSSPLTDEQVQKAKEGKIILHADHRYYYYADDGLDAQSEGEVPPALLFIGAGQQKCWPIPEGASADYQVPHAVAVGQYAYYLNLNTKRFVEFREGGGGHLFVESSSSNFIPEDSNPYSGDERIVRGMNVAGKLVPSYAISDALKVLRVDVNGKGLEFATVESGGGGGSDIETAIIDLPPDTSGLVTRGVIEPVVLGKIVVNPQIYMLKTPRSQNPIPLLSLYTKDSAELVYRTETVETKTVDDYGDSHFVLKTYLVTITLETGAWVLTERSDLLAPTLYGETKVCNHYSVNKQYAVGDYANYRGVMYRCTQAHKATSTFKPAYWVRTNAMTEMNALLPSYAAADAGKVLKVNANGDGLEFATDNAGVSAQEVQSMIDAAIGDAISAQY